MSHADNKTCNAYTEKSQNNPNLSLLYETEGLLRGELF